MFTLDVKGILLRLGVVIGCGVVLFTLLAWTDLELAAQTTQLQSSEAAAANGGGESLIESIFGPDSRERLPVSIGRAVLRLSVAAILVAVLAFRPRRKSAIGRPGPHVAQTQILLGVVACALMMIVADNAARAFGIFAAASLVRFRTNIRDPKEITVLLVSLGVGLAAGVGRWELAAILTAFVLGVLWILEYYEPARVFRPMELTVRTHSVDGTDGALKQLFQKHRLAAEVRELNREDEAKPLGKIVYYLSVGPAANTDRLSEEIFASDPNNIDSVQWHQKKTPSYA